MDVKRSLALGLAGAAVSVSVAAPVHAEDRRPCVALSEARGTHLAPVVTRHELEIRWDVVGLGRDITTTSDTDGYQVYQYKACGLSPDRGEVLMYLQRPERVAGPPRSAIVLMIVRYRYTGRSA